MRGGTLSPVQPIGAFEQAVLGIDIEWLEPNPIVVLLATTLCIEHPRQAARLD